MSKFWQHMQERYPDTKSIPGMDNAILGITHDHRLIYSVEILIATHIARLGMSQADARKKARELLHEDGPFTPIGSYSL